MILVSYCVIWRRALEEAGADRPDLISIEFFLTHLLKKDGNTYNFCSIWASALPKPQFYKLSLWSKLFFFVLGDKREYPIRQVFWQEFPVQANWRVVREDKVVKTLATLQEVQRLEVIHTLVAAH